MLVPLPSRSSRAGMVLGIAAGLLVLTLSASDAAAQGRGQGRGAGPGAGARQERPGAPGRPGAGAGPRAGAGPLLLQDSLSTAGPIELLLTRRDSLRLTSAQVRTLEEIDDGLQRRNGPLLAALVEMRSELQPLIGRHPRDMTPTERQRFTRVADRARPLLQQIRQNNISAMEDVGAVLTPAQKAAVLRWLEDSGLADDAVPGGMRGEPLRLRYRRGAPGGGEG